MNSLTGLLGPPRLSYFQIPVETFTDPYRLSGKHIVTRVLHFVKGRREKSHIYYYAFTRIRTRVDRVRVRVARTRGTSCKKRPLILQIRAYKLEYTAEYSEFCNFKKFLPIFGLFTQKRLVFFSCFGV